MFGFHDRAIIAQNQRAAAIITDVKKCWWFKVNTQSMRTNGMDGAVFPHIIRFTYTVDGVQYHGKRFLSHSIPVPSTGKQIEIFYDAHKPSRCAVIL